ncbi:MULTISPECIES: hypothetical protein [Staphylococcus]|uniref:hypothetical protein n=1 Tax=Staphylococcus TaxID=1279 RepID=UPI000D58B189|nr:hypothetical protein [Staphylococcus nepalensis]AWI44135.1 hypothetical protein BJG88_04805 [Staphylococcus nepalensis]MBO1222568.1 hypothetical protein [Staphylococcus nepalensis]MDR5650007.1 hypothetical protein [Staphylococcus nepalensis]SUM67734.1 Uncharacterised protein [Staphylococcus nepalensis]SUM95279.1 Uncharacterised protein [Staphylococcus nepalensis]
MDYRKEMKKMGWNEDEIVKRINSLAEDNLGLDEEDVDLDAEALKQNHKGFIETDEEQEMVDMFFNYED